MKTKYKFNKIFLVEESWSRFVFVWFTTR